MMMRQVMMPDDDNAFTVTETTVDLDRCNFRQVFFDGVRDASGMVLNRPVHATPQGTFWISERLAVELGHTLYIS